MGTALTVQTCVGFLLTMVSIELVPRLAACRRLDLGLRGAGAGPVLGVVAMQRLRRLPEASRIAHGRK